MNVQFVKQLLSDKKWNDVILYLEKYPLVENIFVFISLYKAHNNLNQYDVMEEQDILRVLNNYQFSHLIYLNRILYG